MSVSETGSSSGETVLEPFKLIPVRSDFCPPRLVNAMPTSDLRTTGMTHRFVKSLLLPVAALFAASAFLHAQDVAPKDEPVPVAKAQAPLPPTDHPALFLVGDSIMHTG